jgi:hypothetical protein
MTRSRLACSSLREATLSVLNLAAHKTTSSCQSSVFTILGYPSLDTASLSEITSARHRSDMVMLNIISVTTEESLNRTRPGPLP